MTYIDKTLKKFGIEKFPLVNMPNMPTQIVVKERYDVIPYANEKKIDTFTLQHYKGDCNNDIVNYQVIVNEHELLDHIKKHIDTDIKYEHGYVRVISTITIAERQE